MILRRIQIQRNLSNLLRKSSVKNGNVMYCGTSTTDTSTEVPNALVVSKAMKAYLERAKEHDEFMKQQNYEYKIGKRHLANMMGEDPETFTQDDVDKAIEYLFPSGLYEKRARPMMKPPEEIYPQRKAAEFDVTGRPHHFLFYTGRPNFYKLLYNIVEHINNLNDFEDSMIRKNTRPDTNLAIITSGHKWLEKGDLEKVLVEQLTDVEYQDFIKAIEKLISLPYSYRIKEFISQYRTPLISQKKDDELPKPKYDSDGRAYITTYECLRKRARGDVTIRSPGTGKITINGKGLDYFNITQCREQVSFFLNPVTY